MQLNSYLPPLGKISVYFPTIYTSLFTVKSQCFLRNDSQLSVGAQAYCSIIGANQFVIVPNGVQLSSSQPYYFTVTNINNPNIALNSTRFQIQTFYSADVYSPMIISSSFFASPSLSLITVKECQLQVGLSLYNPNLPAQYQISLVCPASIKQASQLKLYLSWNPTQGNTTCSGDSTTLYSSQCSIQTEYQQNKLFTYLGLYLR